MFKKRNRKKDKKIYFEIKNKNKDAFIKAYDLYVDEIYRFIYFKVSNKEEAQDLTSSTFLKTWNCIQNNNIKKYKTLRALIYTIARTSVIDYYRKNNQNNLNISLNDENKQFDIEDKSQNIVDSLEKDFDFKLLENKLHELKDEYREVIILRFIDQLTIAEISKIIDKRKGNVRVLIHRALNSLKSIINIDND